MIMIGVFVQAIIYYVARNDMPALRRYYDSIDPSDREFWIKPFTRSFFARVLYTILKLPVPPEIEQENHNMELVEQFKSDWEGIFNQVFPVGLNGLNTEKVKATLLHELAQEEPYLDDEGGSSSETDEDSGEEDSDEEDSDEEEKDEEENQELEVEFNNWGDNDTFQEVLICAFQFTGKQHIEAFTQSMFVEVFRIIRGIPGYSCAGCTLHKENCVCELCEGCRCINPKGMRHILCSSQCPKKEQYTQGQVHYNDN